MLRRIDSECQSIPSLFGFLGSVGVRAGFGLNWKNGVFLSIKKKKSPRERAFSSGLIADGLLVGPVVR